MKNKLFWFYNYTLDKHGMPFALCSKHEEEEKKNPPPGVLKGTIRMDELGETETMFCNTCEQGGVGTSSN